MEITHQIANLEDELKLLKGEIKSVLKEIRAALLNQDNPFTSNSPGLRTGGVAPASLPDVGPAPADVLPLHPSPPPAQEPAPSPFATPPPVAQHDQHAEPQHAVPISEPAAAAQPIPLHGQRPADDEPFEPRTSLLTIASLLAWVEDALASLGARRFRLMLELAYFAELLSPDVRDVLRDVAEIWANDQEPEGPVSVNECLLQIRQLEAVLHGEHVTHIPRRRLRRRSQQL